VRGSSDVDDHDAAVAAVAILVAVPIFVFLIFGAVALPAVVAYGDLEARLLMLSPLLFLAASNLFDDPGFEHDADL
jgi:O-antigen ligase